MPGDFPRHEKLRDAVVREGERFGAVAREQAARGDALGALLGCEGHVEEFLGDLRQALLHLFEREGPFDSSPREQGEMGDRLPQLAQIPHVSPAVHGRHAARFALAMTAADDLVLQPPLQDGLIQSRRGNGCPRGRLARGSEVGSRQVGDEGKHPRVFRKAEQILHIVDQGEAGRGFGGVAELAGEEGFDLVLGERAQSRAPKPRLFEQPENHLVVVLEMLRAAGEHDDGAARRGPGDCAEVIGRALERNAQGEFIVAIEQNHQMALHCHVLQLLRANLLQAELPEPGDEHRGGVLHLVKGAQLDEQRGDRTARLGEFQRELAQQEGLARAEIAVDQDKLRATLADQGAQLGAGVRTHALDGACVVKGLRARLGKELEALGNVECGRIFLGGVQLALLLGDGQAEVRHALVVAPRQELDATFGGCVFERGGGLRIKRVTAMTDQPAFAIETAGQAIKCLNRRRSAFAPDQAHRETRKTSLVIRHHAQVRRLGVMPFRPATRPAELGDQGELADEHVLFQHIRAGEFRVALPFCGGMRRRRGGGGERIRAALRSPGRSISEGRTDADENMRHPQPAWLDLAAHAGIGNPTFVVMIVGAQARFDAVRGEAENLILIGSFVGPWAGSERV